MELFIGAKPVKAKPMRYDEWYLQRYGKKVDKPYDGYLVEYLNPKDIAPEIPVDHYQSWSPKEVFEASYFSSGNLSFSLALEAMKMGFIVINPYQEKRGLKGVLFGKEETPYELLMNGNERFWLPDLYALRCKEWKIVGLANKES